MFRTAISIVLLCIGSSVSAQDASLEDVIRDQLQAFKDRDVGAAWSYASPTIKGIFQTPENFGRMVQNGYPMVWDNSDVLFLDRREFENRTRQEVQIKGPEGAFFILDYQMIQTDAGWQVNGVQVIRVPDIVS